MWNNLQFWIFIMLVSRSFLKGTYATNNVNKENENANNITEYKIISAENTTYKTGVDETTKCDMLTYKTVDINSNQLFKYSSSPNDFSTSTNKTVDESSDWIPVDSPTEEINLNNSVKLIMAEELEKLKNICPAYKESTTKLDWKKMADVWQPLYYKLTDKLQCFKIYLKKVLTEEKNIYERMYGNFSEKVNWSQCNLEVKSSTQMNRKHFLQGTNDDRGILKNIVIIEGNYEEKDAEDTLRDECPDQWMVINNLLFTRDCEDGGVVVFSRVPHQPNRGELEEALKDFGEEEFNGNYACEYNEVTHRTFDNEETITYL